MSLKLPVTTCSVFHQNYVSNQTQINKVNLFTSTTKGNHITLVHKPSNQINTAKTEEEEEYDHWNVINKRNLLVGLGTLFSTAAIFTDQNLTSIAALQHKMGLGLILEKNTIRVLVQRPQKLRTKSKKGNSTTEEVLVVDGIEIHHDGPVKFDVYVAKAHNNGVLSSDLGEFAGSLVNLPFSRMGQNGIQVQGKGSLELGIGGLVRDIDAQDCDEIAVSLVPKLGEIRIDNIRIEGCKNSGRDVDHIGALQPLKPHRTATFASLLSPEMHLLG